MGNLSWTTTALPAGFGFLSSQFIGDRWPIGQLTMCRLHVWITAVRWTPQSRGAIPGGPAIRIRLRDGLAAVTCKT